MDASSTARPAEFLPYLLLLLMACPGHPAWGQSTPVAGYSPGARSATTANTMLDSVVGNSHSPIKKQTSITGDLYHIASDGTVTAPNGLLVSPGGCQTPGSSSTLSASPTGKSPAGGAAAARSHYRFGTGRHGKSFETVMIGISAQPSLTTTGLTAKKTRRAILNASYGPNGLYILPELCLRTNPSDRALILDAATSLAGADGNAFTLAGNRSSEIPVNEARTLPDGDIELRNSALTGNSTSSTATPSRPASISGQRTTGTAQP